MRRGWVAAIVAVLAAGSPAVRAQEPQSGKPKLTARELFFSTLSEKAPSKAQMPPARKQAATKPKAPQSPPPVSEAARIHTPPPQTRPSEPVKSGPPLVRASTSRKAPLGLRYSLLKWVSGRNYEEVDADTVFRAGDRLRISVESNDAGYLYIVQRGASGTWDVLFPNSETEGGENLIEGARRQTIPRGGRFTFDENAGEIRLFVVLSRQPEEDLHKLIYSTSSPQAPKNPEEKKAPPARQGTLLMAQNTISDDVVEKIRGRVFTRDLVFEKVDEEESAQKSREKAVYVVNPEGGDDARVVAEIRLIHR